MGAGMKSKLKPILFNSEMVQALFNGKTQTRRLMKHQPPTTDYQLCTLGDSTFTKHTDGKHQWMLLDGVNVVDGSQPFFSKPYEVGDILYVRETHFINAEEADWFSFYTLDELLEHTYYRADGIPDFEGEECSMRWRPSIHMPKWVARLFLHVTDVRVQRLQEITHEDALAECPPPGLYDLRKERLTVAQLAFSHLWDSTRKPSIHEDGHDNACVMYYNWEDNPWVWCYTFEQISKEEALRLAE
jgi:hypothetical protein